MAIERAQELTRPLCVDLDGALMRGDWLHESLVRLVKHQPLMLLYLPFWLARGRDVLESEVARRVTLNPAALPYNRELLEWLSSERARGRSLWLCTRAPSPLAESVASHLDLFDGVLATQERSDRWGPERAASLVQRFGERGFDYCGNEARDAPVWEHAQGAIVVGTGQHVLQRTAPLRIFRVTGSSWPALLRELRPHQWAKNILVLVPLFAAHHAGSLQADLAALCGALAFCLCSSSVYVLNDLLDLEADRAHPRKSKRPLASGELPLTTGFVLAPALLSLAVLIAAFLPERFWSALATYYGATLAYSFALKGIVLIDALTLAGLYTLRIIAGAAAAQVPLSFWLLLFSVLLFLSLAFVKRFAELDSLRRAQRLRASGRGYHVEDLPLLQSLGTAAGYLSVLVLALYINSPDIQVLYSRPKLIWSLCVLMLYWVSRIWMIAQRGLMHDDPVVFALRDPQSLAIGVLAALTVALAI
jgi:4-hydroxybenzoate polyprenyltransferase